MRATLYRAGGMLTAMFVLMLVSDLAAVVKAKPHTLVLKGAAARAHMEQVIDRHPGLRQLHEKSVAELKAKGYTPTDKQFVKIVTTEPTLLQRAAGWVVPALAAQSYGDGSAETEMSPWDANDDGIFTGEVTMYDYETGHYANGTMAFDVYSQESFGFISANGNVGPNPPQQGPNRFASAVQDWAWCSVGGCAGALTACWLSGPGWGVCTLSWCAGAEVACAVHGIYGYVRPQWQN